MLGVEVSSDVNSGECSLTSVNGWECRVVQMGIQVTVGECSLMQLNAG